MFNKNLRYYRLKNNLSKKELASLCGVTPMAITNYENGSRNPNMDTIKALAAALGTKVLDQLLKEKLISSSVYAECFKGFDQLNGGKIRLPKTEIQNSIKNFDNIY